MNQQRLLDLADVLEHYDGDWDFGRHEHCAMGVVQKVYHISDLPITSYQMAEYFDMDLEDAKQIFCPSAHHEGNLDCIDFYGKQMKDVTPSDVASKIKELAGKDANHAN